MKEKIIKYLKAFLTVLLFPLALLFLLGFLATTPFDYFKYKKTQYYKDTHEKYSWFCTQTYYVKLYNLIKSENLPIDYFRDKTDDFTGYGYFIYKDILILSDYNIRYDSKKNIWIVDDDDDEDINIIDDVESNIKQCNKFLENNICKRAAILINEDILIEYPAPNYENLTFIPISNDDTLSALKKLITSY